MMRTVLSSVAIATVALVTAIAAQSPTTPAEITLAVAGRTNTAPWIAGRGDFVAVVWGAAQQGARDIFLAVSRDGGRHFDAPVQVNAIAGEARINGGIAPRVALSNGVDANTPEIALLWNARQDGSAIRLARSRDGGRTFTAVRTLQSEGVTGDRGWGEHDPVAMARKSALYYASASGTRILERSSVRRPRPTASWPNRSLEHRVACRIESAQQSRQSHRARNPTRAPS